MLGLKAPGGHLTLAITVIRLDTDLFTSVTTLASWDMAATKVAPRHVAHASHPLLLGPRVLLVAPEPVLVVARVMTLALKYIFLQPCLPELAFVLLRLYDPDHVIRRSAPWTNTPFVHLRLYSVRFEHVTSSW